MDLLEQMATFLKVVDAGSLAAASRALDRSVPALSRQLQALEADLGATLIVRTTRRHQVTEAGRAWYRDCRRILDDLAVARQSVRPEAVQGRLTVSAPITLGLHCVVPVLGSLLEQHPKLKVELRLEDQVVDLVAQGIDVVVRAGPQLAESSSLIARPLMSFQRVAVAAPAYLRRRRAPKVPRELSAHACIVQLGGDGPLADWSFARRGASQTVTVQSRVALTAPLAVRDVALAGHGIAWLPQWLVEEDLARGTLKRVLPEWIGAAMSVWVVYRVELRNAQRVRALVDALRLQLTGGEGPVELAPH